MQAFLTDYWPHLFFVLSTIAGLAAAVHAAMTKDEVRAAIGWAGVAMLSPVFGAALYLVAGVNRVRRSSVMRKRARTRRGRAAENEDSTGDALARLPLASLARLGDNVSQFPLTLGNKVTPLVGGDAAYPEMIEAIKGARKSIALATYIFDHDAAGLAFVEALAAAKERGVAVRVLIDAVGARYSKPPLPLLLRQRGVPSALFMGNIIGLKLPYANLRSHRKILVVDGKVGFTGGMNIRAHFLTSAMGDHTARDTHFRFDGPVVEHLLTVFAEDWHFVTRELLDGPVWFGRPARLPGGAEVAARAIPSGPDHTLESNHAMIMGALAAAERRVMISSPYFLPDQQLVGAFGVAARRGIEVDIVIPDSNNLRLVDYAMTAQLDQVLRRGCRVWRARGVFDHSKLMTVDGVWSYIGSSNLDPRSLRLNFELDVEVHDPALASWIEGHISERMADAVPETLQSLAALPLVERLRNRVVWLASPYL